MGLKLNRINYADLNARQKESYNFQKISAILADYGFATIRLSDDWQGADFIAQHIDGETFLKIQLKGRLTFNRKYSGKNIYVVFQAEGVWYLYEHDELLKDVLGSTEIAETQSWLVNGGYSFPNSTPRLLELIRPWQIRPSSDSSDS